MWTLAYALVVLLLGTEVCIFTVMEQREKYIETF